MVISIEKSLFSKILSTLNIGYDGYRHEFSMLIQDNIIYLLEYDEEDNGDINPRTLKSYEFHVNDVTDPVINPLTPSDMIKKWDNDIKESGCCETSSLVYKYIKVIFGCLTNGAKEGQITSELIALGLEPLKQYGVESFKAFRGYSGFSWIIQGTNEQIWEDLTLEQIIGSIPR